MMLRPGVETVADRRRFLTGAAAGVAALAAGVVSPMRLAVAQARMVHKSANLEVVVLSDGFFVMPTTLLLTADAAPAEREAALKAAGQGGDQLQLVNNVAAIRTRLGVVLVDAGTGPRHQPTAGKLIENLNSAGIEPASVTKVVLTHCHPDHLGGVLDARDVAVFPNASYFLSAAEWDVWADPDVFNKLPAALFRERVVAGAKNHLSRIKDKVTMVRAGDEIVDGVRVVDTPGHTQGHISVEIAGGDGLLIAGDALTHLVISFQHPYWRVPADHEPDRGVATRLRLLDRLATDKTRIVAAHLPYPGSGFVERKDNAYRFVAAA
jgi:glyoxylase-like metal-dependent hydrolase (beta-lactamase superfamily II)